MRSSNVSWSDLESAAALSRALAPGGTAPAAVVSAPPSAATAYARLPRAAVAPAAPLPVPELLELRTWEEFLTWSLEETRATAGFVVDAQGFVLASRGPAPGDGFEGIGALLLAGMDQLDTVDPAAGRARLLELQLEHGFLVGVRADAGELGRMLIGFQGARWLTDDVRDRLVRQLQHSVDRLR